MAPMKAVFPLILALLPGAAAPDPAQPSAGCAAFEEDTDGDGRPDRVVLENEFVRLVYTPDGFGRRFLYKPTGTDVLGGVSRMLFHWDVFEVPNSLRPRNPGAVAAGWQGKTRNMAVNEADEPQPITFRQGIRKYSPGVIWGTYVPDIEGPRVAIDLEPGPFSFPALSGTLPSAWIGGVNEKGFGLAVSTVTGAAPSGRRAR